MKENNQFKGWHSRGYLPHYDQFGLTQFVTFRLADSLPIEVCKQLSRGINNNYSEHVARLLDNGIGSCLLKESRNASIVQEVLLARDTLDYKLHAWSIMPTHVHTMFTPFLPLELIVKSWKSISSRRINQTSDETIWYPDYFDRYIRTNDHFIQTQFYIEMNPVKAHLCRKPYQWIFSSAHINHKFKNLI